MNRNLDQYQFTVRPIPENEGGGYLVELDVFRESGRKLPKPAIEAAQWRQRLPRTLYSKLTRQAESEGVSINSLVTAIIAEAIGSRQAPSRKNR